MRSILPVTALPALFLAQASILVIGPRGDSTHAEASGPPSARVAVQEQDAAEDATPQLIEVEEQKTLPHEPPEVLGTTMYQPSKLEKPHLGEFKPEDFLPGAQAAANKLEDRVGDSVSWFGIVREDKWVRAGGKRKTGHHELLVEHKYFDGLTDMHQQIVSFAGGGDFKALLPYDEKKLPFERLSLVRCYGEVVSEKKGVPAVEVKFVRVWPWNNFAFMGLGNETTPDLTNKRWRKRLKIPEQVYSPTPDTEYYEQLLGKQKKW